MNKSRQPVAARIPRVTLNKPSAKQNEINMIKFHPSNSLGGLEDLVELSGVGHLGTHVDNHKDVAFNNVNTDTKTFNTTEPCLTCKQSGHSSDNYPALNSIIHLRKHCVKWKTFLANESGRG